MQPGLEHCRALIAPGAGSAGRDGRRSRLSTTAVPHPVHELLIALALLLVAEGVWPFLSPPSFRRALLMVAGEPDGRLRLTGLISMVVGVGLLYLVN